MKWASLITTPHSGITDAVSLPLTTPQESEIKVLSNIRRRSGMKQLQLIATVAHSNSLCQIIHTDLPTSAHISAGHNFITEGYLVYSKFLHRPN
jgi:hypothetical protein